MRDGTTVMTIALTDLANAGRDYLDKEVTAEKGEQTSIKCHIHATVDQNTLSRRT
jgi:hypothetical protein